MGLSNALFASVTGLDTSSTAISVIGDNIANSNTPGFKERRAVFADALGQSLNLIGGFSQTGAGAKVASITQVFSQGTFETTGRSTDLAIEGNGFFVLDGPTGRAFTRVGAFNFNDEGLLMTPLQERVQGFGIDSTTLQPTGGLGDIQLVTSQLDPQDTSRMELSLNLNSNSLTEEPLVGPFDPSDPSQSSHFQSVVTVFDSLGNGHPATIYFTQTGPGAWDWNMALPPADTSTPPATAGDPVVVQGSGTLGFDSDGVLQAVTGTPVTFEFSGGATSSQAVDLDFGGLAGVGSGDFTTQYADRSSTINAARQDGFASGSLQSLSIGIDGLVVGRFSNGESRPLAQLALAIFPNTEGLAATGNNNFIESRQSGQPLVGAAQSGRFGAIRSESLEQSNVDLSAQFIRLIINQRAFQANSRTVSVANELLANVVQLGQ
ncbi:MAG: flagellar hook protein FlgE [Myxococcales bacterium]|nr:flagellar hook protein FlgE [Myxococcales bacterium]